MVPSATVRAGTGGAPKPGEGERLQARSIRCEALHMAAPPTTRPDDGDPLGPLQQEVMFSTTPWFGTEGVGRPRRSGAPPAPGGGWTGHSSEGTPAAVRARPKSGQPRRAGTPAGNRAGGGVAPPEAVPQRADTQGVAAVVPRPKSAPSTGLRGRVAAPRVSTSILPHEEANGVPSGGDGRAEEALPGPAPDDTARRVSVVSLLRQAVVQQYGRTSRTPVATTRKPLRPVSAHNVATRSPAPLAKPAPPPTAVPPAAAVPALAREPSSTLCGARRASAAATVAGTPSRATRWKTGVLRHVAPRPPPVLTLQDVEDLRRRQCEELLLLLEREQLRERARLCVLASERSRKRRALLEATFHTERVAAQEKLDAMKRDFEVEVAAHLIRLGVAR